MWWSMGMTSSVLDLLRLKCYRDIEFGWEVRTEITGAENAHLEKTGGAQGGREWNVKADNTEGWAEDIVQENKNATFVCDIGPWEVRWNSRDSWSTKSCTTNKIFGSMGGTNSIQCCQIHSIVARLWERSFSRERAENSKEAVRPEDQWAMRNMRLMNGFLLMKSDSMQKREMGQ